MAKPGTGKGSYLFEVGAEGGDEGGVDRDVSTIRAVLPPPPPRPRARITGGGAAFEGGS